MNQINLEFYGEIVTVIMPTNLEALRAEISKQFLFDRKDADELIIKANFSNLFSEIESFSISTEMDYSILLFNHPEIEQLIIEVNEKSRLFAKKKAKVLLEQSLEDQLVSLKLDTLELINKEKEEYAKGIRDYNSLKNQLDEMKKTLRLFSKEIIAKHTTQSRLIRRNKKAIESLETVIHSSLVKENSSEDNDKDSGENNVPQGDTVLYERLKDMNLAWHNSKDRKRRKKPSARKSNKKDEKIVHKQVKCDGCNMLPIQGIRYNCSVCENFNYCQKCRNKFGYIHQHTFIGIPIPRKVLNPIHLEYLAPYSSLNKIIQCKYKQANAS